MTTIDFCRNGHPYLPETTRYTPARDRPGRFYRRCLTCRRTNKPKRTRTNPSGRVSLWGKMIYELECAPVEQTPATECWGCPPNTDTGARGTMVEDDEGDMKCLICGRGMRARMLLS